jgi:hypothetical protein
MSGVTINRAAFWLVAALVVAGGCASQEGFRASEPSQTATVQGSAAKVASCVNNQVDVSIEAFDQAGTTFSFLARCDWCMQGYFHAVTVKQIDADQVRVELRENKAFVLGVGNPWPKVERCLSGQPE